VDCFLHLSLINIASAVTSHFVLNSRHNIQCDSWAQLLVTQMRLTCVHWTITYLLNYEKQIIYAQTAYKAFAFDDPPRIFLRTLSRSLDPISVQLQTGLKNQSILSTGWDKKTGPFFKCITFLYNDLGRQ